MAKFKLREIIAVSEPVFANNEPIPRYIGTKHYVAVVQDVWFTKTHVGWYTLTIVTSDNKWLTPRLEIRRMQKNINKRATLYGGT
jgi:hypothetical protein